MDASKNLALHAAWTAAEDRQDLTHHHEFLHPDIVVNQAGAEPVVGLDGYRTMMKESYDGLAGWHVILDDEFATDDRVVCRWRMSGTHVADSFGFPATNRHLEFSGISLWEFESGKAKRGWLYPDVVAIMTQLGSE